MTHNVNIPGWAGDIYAWLDANEKRIPQGGTYLEIGTFMGASLAHIGTLRPDIELIAVDPWLDAPSQGYCGPGEYTQIQNERGGLFPAFLWYMTRFAPDVLKRTRIIRGTAKNVRLITTVDLLFIDGAHDVDSVLLDIDVFSPLVRTGGLIAGHDFNPTATNYAIDGVAKAVEHRFDLSRVHHEPPCSVWWVQA